MTKNGNRNIKIIKRAMILLKSDEGLDYKEIMKDLGVSKPSVWNVRRK